MSGRTPRLPDGVRFLIDLKHDCLYYEGNLIDLDSQDFKVFRALYESSPAFLYIAEIIAAAWQGTSVGENSVHQSVAKIRKALGDCGNEKVLWVKGKRHRGYRLAWQGKDTERDKYIAVKTHDVVVPELMQNRTLSRIELTDTHLIALDISGTQLWTYRFPFAIRRTVLDRDEWRCLLIDIYGTGELHVLVTARFIERRQPDSIMLLSPAGKVVWTLEASPDLLDHDGSIFPRAWRFSHLIPCRTSKGHLICAALINDAGWSGCVIKIDPLRNVSTQFANSGFVEQLCPITIDGEECFIACGENNAFDLPFVALIGLEDLACSSPPGGRPRYRYGNPPTGHVRRYILFPKTEVIDVLAQPYGHAEGMDQWADNIIVRVQAAGAGAHFRYHFTPMLDPKYVFPSGNYEFAHRDLELTTRLDHPLSRCPELAGPLPLKIWTPGRGWHGGAIPWRDDNPWQETQENGE